MDALPSLGTAIPDILLPTYRVYAPLLIRNADAIRSTTRSTHVYGPHSRHALDLYSPRSESPRRLNKRSVLIFVYGGGLVRGNKNDPEFAQGLSYANVGHFFSERMGVQVVIPDYRLLSHGATFPSGGEDIALVVEWVCTRLSHNGQKLDIILMGNSAGGLHLSTYLLASELSRRRNIFTLKGRPSAELKAVILLSVPFAFEDAKGLRRKHLESYYGNDLVRHSPLALLKEGLKEGLLDYLVNVSTVILTCSLDPEVEILEPTAAFVKVWQDSALSTQLTTIKLQGHNHVSPALSLGTGIPIEEAWGQQLIDCMVVASS